MKLSNKEKLIAGFLILAPWAIILCSYYFNMTSTPVIAIACCLLLVCISGGSKLALSMYNSVFILIGYVLYLGLVFSLNEDPSTTPLYRLPFAKQCSPSYNQQVLYRIDKAEKKVIFTPRSEYFWGHHKDDGIAEKIRSFQAMPIQEAPPKE